ncbi:VWD domain-containing protein [Halorubrum sp. CBA1125]|uniref:VWD domain-containing protein n=1 Tax=Halorubrum sp. CBA1125 TaxID=2668072 RepID=UPI0018D24640|nr:VWD domain-containing protein [Halorubrum sp. CBA1125]
MAIAVGAGGAAATGDANVTVGEGDEPVAADDNGTAISATSAGSSDAAIRLAESDDSYGSDPKVAVTVVPTGGSFASDETMEIFVGAFNDSATASGLANVPLTVTVERPDGITSNYTVTTDSDGGAKVDYDLAAANRGNGTYTVTVTDGSASATVAPTVGPSVEPAERDYEDVPIGEEADLDFLVRNGEFGQANEPVTVTVTAPNGTIIDERQVETEGDGFVSVPVTPREQGRYEVTAEVAGTGSTATHGVMAREVVFRSSVIDLTNALAGERSSYGGYLLDGDGPVGETEVVVEFYNSSDVVIANETATTGDNGFFSVEYVPDDSNDLDVDIRTENDTRVLEDEYVDVEDPTPEDESPGGGNDVDVSVQSRSYTVEPGSNAVFDIKATEDGSPIANQDVTVFARLDYNGAPLATRTVTTNETGSAVVSVPTSEEIDGADIDGRATMEYDGTTASDSLSVDVQQYEVDIENLWGTQAGQQVEFTVRAENTSSDGGGEEIPLQYNALTNADDVDSYATGEIVTDETGVGSEAVAVPREIAPYNAYTYATRYEEMGGYYVNVFDLPGSVEPVGDPVVAPGGDVAVNFTTPDGTEASGLAFAPFEYDDPETDAQGNGIGAVSTSSNGTISVPEYAADDRSVTATVWAADAKGRFYTAETSFEVDADAADNGTAGGGGGGAPVPVVNTTASSVSPTTVASDELQTYEVTVAIENTSLSDDTGEVDVQFDDFVLEGTDEDDEPGDDLTIEYGTEDVTNGTLTASANVTATAPSTSGVRAVSVTDLRRENDSGAVEYLIEDANISIGTIEVTAVEDSERPAAVDLADLDGNGTEAAPYVVTNVSELRAIEGNLSATYMLGDDINASDTSEWNNQSGFDPIGGSPSNGSTPDPFSGSLDGNGSAITGLVVDRSSEVGVGLFGVMTAGGSVSNLTLKSATVRGDSSVGGLVGVSAGTVENVSVSGSVDGAQYAGGVVGRNIGTAENVTASASANGTQFVGGLAGRNIGTIENATASGSAVGSSQVGGLVGVNDFGTIENATATGNVSGTSYIGGLVGDHGGIIENAEATGDVDGSSYVGGLSGGNFEGTIAEATASGSVDGNTSVGGLSGDNLNGTVENVSASGPVNGSETVGGLVGENSGTIRDAFVTGEVTGSVETGGLVGMNAIEGVAGTIRDSYWDEEATGQAVSPGNATGLTTAQMIGEAARTNMSGLEFGTAWRTQADGYPVLLARSDGDRPDVEFTIGGWDVPGVIARNETLEASALVENQGNVTATTTVELYVDGEVVNETTRTIGANESREVALGYNPTQEHLTEIDVYVATEDDESYARDVLVYNESELVRPDPDAVEWVYESERTGQESDAGSLFTDDTLVTTGPGPEYESYNLTAIDTEDGDVHWERERDDWLQPLGVTDGAVIVEEQDTLVAYGIETGERRWSVEGEGLRVITPREELDRQLAYGEIYVEADGDLRGIDATTGEVTMNVSGIDPAEIHRGHDAVYVAEIDYRSAHEVHTVSLNGTIRWNATLDDAPRDVTLVDEQLVVETGDGVIGFKTGVVDDTEREWWQYHEDDFDANYWFEDAAALENGVLVAFAHGDESTITLLRLDSTGTVVAEDSLSGDSLSFHDGESGLYGVGDQIIRFNGTTGDVDWTANASSWSISEDRGHLATVHSGDGPIDTAVVYDAVDGTKHEVYESPVWLPGPGLATDTMYVTDTREQAIKAIRVPEIDAATTEFDVEDVTVDEPTSPGETVAVTSTITNPGNETTVRGVDIEVTSADGEIVYVDSSSVSVTGGESEDVAFNDVLVGPDAGEYAITVSTATRNETTTVSVDDEDAQPDVNASASSVTPTVATANETQEYMVNVTVENTSLTTASGEVDVAFEAFDLDGEEDSENGTEDEPDAGTQEDLTIEYTDADLTNGTLSVSGTVNATAPDANGVYEVVVTDLRREGEGADDTDTSLIEDANVTIGEVEVVGPNFQVTSTTAPGSASAGSPVTYTATISNIGGRNGTQPVTSTFGGETVATREVSLNANESRTLAFTATGETSGTVDATVSTENDNAESTVEIVGQEFVTGQSTGDPHITTFGGASYDFMGAGDFVLAHEPQGDLLVVARQSPVSDSVSNNNATATLVGDARVVIDAEASSLVSIDGQPVSMQDGDSVSVDNGSGQIVRRGDTYTVYYAGDDGEVTESDEHLTANVVGDRIDIELSLHPDRSREVEGLLGDVDGDRGDDIAYRNGTALNRPLNATELYGPFRDDWRATGDENPFAENYYVATFPENVITVADLPEDDRQRAEDVLADTCLVPGTPQYRDALIDVALTSDSSYVASACRVDRRNVTDATEETFTVDITSVPSEVTADTNVSVEAEITNEAGVETSRTIEFRVDGDTVETRTVELGPTDAYDVSAQQGVTLAGDSVYVTENETIFEIDRATGEVVSQFDAPEGKANGLAYGNGSLWFVDGAADAYDGEIVELDPETGAVRSHISDYGYDLNGITYADGSIWAVEVTHNSVRELDPDTGDQRSQFDVRTPLGTTRPSGIAYQNDTLWVGTGDTAELGQFTTDGELLQRTGDRDARYKGLTADQTALYGSGAGGNLSVLRRFGDSDAGLGGRTTETFVYETDEADVPAIAIEVASETDSDTATVSVNESDSEPTDQFVVESVQGPNTISQAQAFSASATITNPGPNASTEPVVFGIDTDRDGDIETVETRNLTLDSGGTTTVGFLAPSSLQPGGYVYGIRTASDQTERSLDVVAEEFKTGLSTGDPHLVTFDGVAYDFMAAGEYVLAHEPNGSLEIQARQEPVSRSDSVTINTALAATLDGHTVTIDAADATPVHIDGTPTELGDSEQVAVGNGTVKRSGNTYTVVSPGADNEPGPTDEHISADLIGNRLDIAVNLDPDREKRVEGLLGNVDGNSSNDLAFANGTVVSGSPGAETLYGSFRDSWRVTNDTTVFAYESGNGPETYYDPLVPADIVTLSDIDPATRAEAEQLAEEVGLEPGTVAYRNAIIDYALTGDESYLASAQQQDASTNVTRNETVDDSPPLSIAIDENASDTAVTTGTNGTLVANVTNDGDQAAQRNVTLERDGRALAERNVTLSANETTPVTFEYPVDDADPGTDRELVVTAGDASDSLAVAIQPATTTLLVEDVVAPELVDAGDTLAVDATVHNDGEAAGTQPVELRVGGETLDTANVTLEPGTSRNVTLSATVNATAIRTTTVAVASVNDTARTVTAVSADPPTSDELAVEFAVPNDGEAHAVGIPTELEGTLADVVDPKAQGAVVYQFKNGENASWTPVFGDFEEVELDTLDAILIVTEGGETQPKQIAVRLPAAERPNTAVPSTRSLEEGYNFVAPPVYGEARAVFDLDGVHLVLDRFDDPTPVSNDIRQADEFDNVLLTGSSSPEAVSPFTGYYVFAESETTLPSVVGGVSTRDDLLGQLRVDRSLETHVTPLQVTNVTSNATGNETVGNQTVQESVTNGTNETTVENGTIENPAGNEPANETDGANETSVENGTVDETPEDDASGTNGTDEVTNGTDEVTNETEQPTDDTTHSTDGPNQSAGDADDASPDANETTEGTTADDAPATGETEDSKTADDTDGNRSETEADASDDEIETSSDPGGEDTVDATETEESGSDDGVSPDTEDESDDTDGTDTNATATLGSAAIEVTVTRTDRTTNARATPASITVETATSGPEGADA